MTVTFIIKQSLSDTIRRSNLLGFDFPMTVFVAANPDY